jgi:hypothetical protein
MDLLSKRTHLFRKFAVACGNVLHLGGRSLPSVIHLKQHCGFDLKLGFGRTQKYGSKAYSLLVNNVPHAGRSYVLQHASAGFDIEGIVSAVYAEVVQTIDISMVETIKSSRSRSS